MPEYSIRDLTRRLRNIITEASLKPVVITQRNKPRLVLLSIETYRRLMARADTRKAGRLKTMPDELFEDFKDAVSACEKEANTIWIDEPAGYFTATLRPRS